MNNIYYKYFSLWQSHKVKICWCDGWMVRSEASSFLLILVYFFHKHSIKNFGSVKCFGPFFLTSWEPNGIILFFHIHVDYGQGKTLPFLVEVRENTSIMKMKSQGKVSLKKHMNPVLYKTLILSKVYQKWQWNSSIFLKVNGQQTLISIKVNLLVDFYWYMTAHNIKIKLVTAML